MPPAADLARLLAGFGPEQLRQFIRGLEPDDVSTVERVLGETQALGWRADPGTMAAHLEGESWRHWVYVRLLCTAFRRAVEGSSTRQIWNVPSRYGKSTIASQRGPAWALDRNPWMKIALTSYGDELADQNASTVRDYLVEHADQLRVRLRRDRRRADRFVTDEGGGIVAAGVGSALVGFGAHGIVVDDPFKNWQEAHSAARRDVVWNWYRSVVRTRLESDDAWIIVVMTRWHEDDLTGKLIAEDERGDGEGWEVIRLPALAEDDDPIGRAPGEALEPERFSLESVLTKARALGSYLAAGLEQQRPAPEEGGELKRAWWQWATAAPPRFDDAASSWDMKLKDKESGDFVVGQAWGRTATDYWLLEQLRGQWNQPTVTNAIALLAVRHPECTRHYVENTGNGPEVMEALRAAAPGYTVDTEMVGLLGMTDEERRAVESARRRGVTGIVPVNPKGSKIARARAEAGLLEAGNVHLVEGDAGALALVDEAASFPNGSHDDMVDAWSQALFKMRHGAASVTRPPQRRLTPPVKRARVVRPQRR